MFHPFWNIFSFCLPLPWALSTLPQPPTPSPCLNISLPLPPQYFLSLSLDPCLVTSYPHCEGDRVISVMSSKGKREKAAGGKWGWQQNEVTRCPRFCNGLPWCLQAAHSAPKIHLLYSGCHWRHSTWAPLYPNARRTAHLIRWSVTKDLMYLQKSIQPTAHSQPASQPQEQPRFRTDKITWIGRDGVINYH